MSPHNPNDLTGQPADPLAAWPGDFLDATRSEKDLALLLDLPVLAQVELGRAKLHFRELLHMQDGTVVELDSDAGQPVDIVVNGCLLARGEIVILNNRYGLRVTDIVSPSERRNWKRS